MEAKYYYKKLEAYKESKTLVIMIYKLLRGFPREETYALCDQLRRAVVSVPSNLAEGSGRTSAIEIAQELGYISSNELNDVTQQIRQVAALLSGMRNKALERTL